MGETLYPSGPWTGFYNYSPSDKHRMDLNLEFCRGRLTGCGIDDVGRFLVKGRYDASAGECHWIKTYPGSHDVFYQGFREGKGIWGTWNIEFGAGGHGGFHIWPRCSSDADAVAENERAPIEIVQPQKVCAPTHVAVALKCPVRPRAVEPLGPHVS
ncbi:MAG: hypothetical protein QHJ82_11205 [Verrucomicrobiota bacterium]|nr:hypothetical protein [Verrucomicrobiota bacterium]